jgi:hypothetical protein
MGSTIIGLPTGIATALNEIARNTSSRGRNKKYRTEDDFYNEFVRAGGVKFSISNIKDPLRKRLFKRAKERYNTDYPKEHKLETARDMYNILVKHGIAKGMSILSQSSGKDIDRQKMAQEAENRYRVDYHSTKSTCKHFK